MNNNFYYKGICVPKENFTISQIAKICDKVNDCEKFILSESKVKNNNNILFGYVALTNDSYLFCEYKNNKCIFGIYDKNNFSGIKQDDLFNMNDSIFAFLAKKISNFAYKIENKIPYEKIIDISILNKWYQYKQEMNLSKDNILRTKDARFVNRPHEKEINTPEELKTAIQRTNKSRKSYDDWER